MDEVTNWIHIVKENDGRNTNAIDKHDTGLHLDK